MDVAAKRVAAAEAAVLVARHEAEVEAARHEAERREAEVAQQWQELMLKVLEHRFIAVPVALVRLLQAVKPAQRTLVSDIILDSPDVDACLQALRQLQTAA